MKSAAERRAIRISYNLASPVPIVWRTLTEPDLLAQWLMPNNIKPQVGHRFTFTTAPAPGFDGIVHCEILEAETNQRLVYTWRGGPIDTIVTWTLEPEAAGGTRLHLVQDGFRPSDDSTYGMLERGWREKAADAIALLAGTLG